MSIVSLSKWSLTGSPPRIDLILLLLICRVTPIMIKLRVLIYKVHTTSHTYVRIYLYVVHPKNYENKYTTIQCIKLHCPRFGLSTFWCVDVLVCRCFGMSTFFGLFWFVDVLFCRRFGLSMFWYVDVVVCRRFGLSTIWFVDALVCRRFGLSTFRCVDVSVCRRFGCRRFGLSTF